jgi:hypothetical protein
MQYGLQPEERPEIGEDGIRYTRKRIAEKYPACQLLYWYRSNELWKKGEGKMIQ